MDRRGREVHDGALDLLAAVPEFGPNIARVRDGKARYPYFRLDAIAGAQASEDALFAAIRRVTG